MRDGTPTLWFMVDHGLHALLQHEAIHDRIAEDADSVLEPLEQQFKNRMCFVQVQNVQNKQAQRGLPSTMLFRASRRWAVGVTQVGKACGNLDGVALVELQLGAGILLRQGRGPHHSERHPALPDHILPLHHQRARILLVAADTRHAPAVAFPDSDLWKASISQLDMSGNAGSDMPQIETLRLHAAERN